MSYQGPSQGPPIPPSEQNCGNCFAFRPHSGQLGGAGAQTEGECRLNPPQVVLTAPIGGQPLMNRQSWHPDVNVDDWCAQWMQK